LGKKPKEMGKRCTKTYTNCFEAMGARKNKSKLNKSRTFEFAQIQNLIE
jgi:hypothetical protein